MKYLSTSPPPTVWRRMTRALSPYETIKTIKSQITLMFFSTTACLFCWLLFLLNFKRFSLRGEKESFIQDNSSKFVVIVYSAFVVKHT